MPIPCSTQKGMIYKLVEEPAFYTYFQLSGSQEQTIRQLINNDVSTSRQSGGHLLDSKITDSDVFNEALSLWLA